MSQDRLGPRTEQLEQAADRSWPAAVFRSPFLWGIATTVGFYCLIPVLPVQREFAVRYFCGHPLEYLTTVLFFVGMAILALKGVGLLSDRRALAASIDHDPLARCAASAALQERVAAIETWLHTLPLSHRRTCIGRRLQDVCAYIRGQGSSHGLEEHLKYLAELASERLHSSYALVRTITWAVPILGFLGTVVGITIAIANVTPEQLDSSLADVTGGLAVAFDTTALSLALSLAMVFGSFLVERSEQAVLAEVEEIGIKRIGCWFPSSAQSPGPLAEAEAQAARTLIENTESLVRRQTELWQESLEALRCRWTETMAAQQHSLNLAIQKGTSATLADHAQQLATLRGEFLQSFQAASKTLGDNLARSQEAQRQWQQEFGRQFTHWWKQVQGDVQGMHQTAAGQIAELQKQGELLRGLIEDEAQLTRLEERLAENLQAVRVAEAFDQTLHSLNAAVHLLTARATSKAA
jgi:biopolymer transport protein ExbB/TolQ